MDLCLRWQTTINKRHGDTCRAATCLARVINWKKLKSTLHERKLSQKPVAQTYFCVLFLRDFSYQLLKHWLLSIIVTRSKIELSCFHSGKHMLLFWNYSIAWSQQTVHYCYFFYLKVLVDVSMKIASVMCYEDIHSVL